MSVFCECCVLSGRGLCDEVITRPEESYRLWCVVVCDLETSWMRRPWPTGGLLCQKQTIIMCEECSSPVIRLLWKFFHLQLFDQYGLNSSLYWNSINIHFFLKLKDQYCSRALSVHLNAHYIKIYTELGISAYYFVTLFQRSLEYMRT